MSSPSSYFFWQKGIAFFLIFSFFFTGVLTPVPFVQAQSSTITLAAPSIASKKPHNNLVVILAASSIFSPGQDTKEQSLSGKIYRYAEDIRTHLPNTKVLILNVDATMTPVQISDSLEKLYFDGDTNDFEENHLSGVILIGDIPKAEITISENYSLESIAPFVDFEDNAVLYSPKTQIFERTGKTFRPEVWHGIIPSFKNNDQLAAFFDENHAYYTGEKKVKKEVLYTDFIAESKAFNDSQFDLYQNTQKYAEDIAYKRFTQKFLNTILQKFQHSVFTPLSPIDQKLQEIQKQAQSGKCLWGAVPQIESFIQNVNLTASSAIPDIYSVFDLQKFLPEFGKVVQSYIQKVYQNVGYSGRWTDADVAYFAKDITLKDVEMREKLKFVNDTVQKSLIEYTEKNWQTPVEMPIKLNEYALSDGGTAVNPKTDTSSKQPSTPLFLRGIPIRTYDNFLYGTLAKNINDVYQCSWFRGSQVSDNNHISQLIEMNRTFDLNAQNCTGFSGCCTKNMGSPQKCEPNNASQSVISSAGSHINTTAEAASYKNCLVENWRNFTGDANAENFDRETKKMSSVFVHNEPNDKTIQDQITQKFTSSLPVDAVPYIDFQNSKKEYTRIDFPNIFKASELTGRLFLADAAQKIQEMQKQEGLKTTIPDDFFLQLFSADFLRELDVWMAWKQFSLSQKYHFLSLTDAFQVPVGDKRELHYLRGKMQDGKMVLSIDPYQSSKKDLMFDVWNTQAQTAQLPSEQAADTNKNLDITQKCGSYEGVEIWQWPGAVMCWLQELRHFKILDTYQFQHAWSDSFQDFRRDIDNFKSQLDSFSGSVGTKNASSFVVAPTLVGNAKNPPFIPTIAATALKTPERMTLIQSDTTNGIQKHDFTIQLLENSQKLFAGFAEADVTLPSGVMTDAKDVNTEKAGLQVALIQGEAHISLWTENPVQGEIQVKSGDLMARTQLDAIAKPHIQVKNDAIKSSEGFSSTTLHLQLDHDFSGDLPVYFSSDSRVFFYQKEAVLRNGKLDMPVVFASSKDPIKLSVSSPALGVFDFTLAAQEQVPVRFLTDQDEFFIQAGKTFPLKIQVVDAFLNPIKTATEFTVFVTPASNDFTPLKSQKVTAQNGSAVVDLASFAQHGDIHLQLAADGMETKIITLHTGITIAPEDIKNNNALFTFFAQEGNGNADDFITALLQSGSMAVAQRASKTSQDKVRFSLDPQGNFKLFDTQLRVEDLGNLQFQLSNTSTLEHYLTWQAALSPTATISTSDKNADIFIDTSLGTPLTVDKNFDIFMGADKIANAGKNGLQINDNRFEKSVKTEGGKIVETLQFENIAVLKVSFRPQSYAVISQTPLVKKQGKNLILASASSTAISHVDGVGWGDEDISILEAAARMPFGQAFMEAQGINDVFWGDPALSYAFLSSTLTQSGFEPTTGTREMETDDALSHLRDFDYNHDGIPDMVMQKGDNTLALLEGTEHGNFINRGDYGLAADGISQIETGDFLGDGFDDILVASSSGKVYFFNNEKGHISPETTAFLTDAREIDQMQVEDFDKDGIKDIVLATSRGELMVYYGSAKGFEKQAHSIASYGIELNHENAGSDVRVTESGTVPNFEVQFQGKNYTVQNFVDLNSDGIKDLVLAQKSAAMNPTTSTPAILPSDGEQVIAYGNSGGTFVFNKILVYGQNSTPIKASQIHLPQTLSISVKKGDSFAIQTLTLQPVSKATKYYASTDRNPLDVQSLVNIDMVIPANAVKKGEYIIDTLPPTFTFLTSTVLCNDKPCSGQLLPSKDIAIGPMDGSNMPLHIRYQTQVTRTPRVPFSWNEKNFTLEIPKIETQFQPGTDRKWTEGKITSKDATNPTTPNPPKDLNQVADNAVKQAWGVSLPTNTTGKSDTIVGLEDKLKMAVDFLETLNCRKGSCLNLPINKAFLVPGTWGIAPSLLSTAKGTTFFSGLAQGVNNTLDRIGLPLAPNPSPTPMFGIKSVLCPGTPVYPAVLPCYGKSCYADVLLGACSANPASPTMNFRSYISPTLTGGLGMALCAGTQSLFELTTASAVPVAGPAKTIVGGKCAAFALPVSDLISSCQKAQDSVDSLTQSASSQTYGNGGTKTLLNVDGLVKKGSAEEAKNYAGLTIGINTFEQLLAKDDLQNDSTYPFFKNLFTRWWDAQKAQFAKLLMLPTITLYYPDMSAVLNGGEDELGNKMIQPLIPKFQAALDTMKQNQQNKTQASNIATNAALVSPQVDSKFLGKIQSTIIDPASQKMQSIKNSIVSQTDEIGAKFQSVFDVIENIPFVVVEKKPIDINLPWMNPQELNSLITTLEAWLKTNEKEINRFTQQLQNIQKKCQQNPEYPQKEFAQGISASVCGNMVGVTAAVDLGKLLSAVRQNIEILKQYRDYPQTLAKYKTQLSYYFVDALHYVNALMNALGGWIERNRLIAEKYIILYYTVVELIHTWENISLVFNDYMASCDSCKADVYSQNFNLQNILFGFIPTPPIVVFPRWPDVILDMSHVQMGIKIVLPELRFHAQEVSLNMDLRPIKLPELDFNIKLDLNFDIPNLPILPQLPPLPNLPNFPSLPMIQLPDLPPPPKLPKLLDCIADWADIVRLVLKVYCLITNGLWVYPESDLTQVIESLTNRSSGFMIPIDFLQAQWPDISYPWIDSINVDGYLRVQPKLDMLAQPVEKVAEKINATSASVISNIQNSANDTINSVADTINQSVEAVNSTSSTIEQGNQKLLQDINQKSNDLKQKTQQMLNPQSSLPSTLYKNFDEMYANLSPEHKEKVHSLNMPSLLAYQSLANTLLKQSRQELADAKILASTQSIEQIHHFAYAKDYALAGNTAASSQKEITLQQNAALSDIQNASSSQTQTPEQGMYLYDAASQKSENIMKYAPQSASISSMRFVDYDKDKDDDIAYTARNSLFLKKNYEKNGTLVIYEHPSQVGDISQYLPIKRAVHGISVTSSNQKADINWKADDEADNAGYILEIKRFVDGYDLQNDALSEFIFLLKDPLFTQEGSFLGSVDIPLGQKNFVLRTGEKAQILAFHSPSFTWTLKNDFYYFRMHAIKNTGELSTVSQQFLLSPQSAYDRSSPNVIENNIEKVPVLKDWPISAGATDDESTVEYFWDTNNDGNNDFTGDTITFPAQEVLGDQKLDITARDTAGNARSYSKTIQVYAPVPNITTASTQEITGFIEPKVPMMPFALLRKREGKITLITPKDAARFYTDAQGNFSIQKNADKNGILIRDAAGKDIALVANNTGYTTLFNSDYALKAIPATQTSPLQLGVMDATRTIVASISFNSAPRPVIIQTNKNTLDTANINVFDVNTKDHFRVLPIPSSSRYFSGGAALLGNQNEVMAAISPEGSIQILSNSLQLRVEQDTKAKQLFFVIQIQNGDDLIRVNLGDIQGSGVNNQPFTVGQMGTHKAMPQQSLFSRLYDFTTTRLHDYTTTRLHDFTTTRLHDYIPLAHADDTPLSGVEKTKKNLTMPFTDLNPTHPYYKAIMDLYQRNILKGYDDGSFHPDSQISRAEFVKIALGATTCFDCSSPTDETKAAFQKTKPFPDVNLVDWFYYCISIAKKEKMVTGYGDGVFRPQKNISRKEAAAILLRQIKADLTPMPKGFFRDVPDYDWAKDYVYTAVQLGMIKNTGGFTVPNEEITRGEFAMMASRILEIRACQIQPEYQDTHEQIVGKLPSEQGSGKEKPSTSQGTGTGTNGAGTGPTQDMLVLPDGTSIAPQKDGTVKITKPDGTVITTKPDGSPTQDSSTNKPTEVLPIFTKFAGVCPGFKNDLCPVLPESFHQNTPQGIVVSPVSRPNTPSSTSTETSQNTQTTTSTQTQNPPSSLPSQSTTSPVTCIFVDQLEDFLPGDTISAIILATDNRRVFSKSNEMVLGEL